MFFVDEATALSLISAVLVNKLLLLDIIKSRDCETLPLIPIKFVIGSGVPSPVGPVGVTPRVGWTRQGPVIIARWTHPLPHAGGGGWAASCRRLRVM